VLLLQGHANRLAARLLAAIVSLIAVSIFAELAQSDLSPASAVLLACLNINTELAFGPLIYLLVRSVLFPERRLRAVDLLNFLPMAAGCLIWMIAWTGVEDPQPVLNRGLTSLIPLVPFLGFKALVLFSYLGAALLILHRALESGRRYIQGKRRLDIRRLRGWLLALSLIPLVIYLTAFAELLGADFQIESDLLSGLLLTALVFAVLTLLLVRPGLLSIHARPALTRGNSAHGKRLLAWLEDRRPWRDSDLDLARLAQQLSWSENHLSQVINEDLASNFYALLARFRLREFERLARDPEARDRSVLDLALEAGFNSKASFYRVFRQRHGATTPAAFRLSATSS
jgi:AraC-like DNA-binding protein